MSFVFNKEFISKFTAIKYSNEDILWVGKPKFIPYILNVLGTALSLFVFGVFWLFIFIYNSVNDKSPMTIYSWVFALIPLFL